MFSALTKPQSIPAPYRISGVKNWVSCQNFTVGQSVESIENFIDPANPLYQSSGAAQAVANSAGSLLLDITKKYQFTSHTELNIDNFVTLIVVLKPTDLSFRNQVFWNRVGNVLGQWALEIGTGNGFANSVSITGPSVFICRTGANVLTPNKDHIITYVRNGSAHQFFIDGLAVNTTTVTQRDFFPTNTVKTLPDSYVGTFYEMISANRALSFFEITELHQDIISRRRLAL